MDSRITFKPDTLDRPIEGSVSGVIEVCVLHLYVDEDAECLQIFESEEISFTIRDPCDFSSIIVIEDEIVLEVQQFSDKQYLPGQMFQNNVTEWAIENR